MIADPFIADPIATEAATIAKDHDLRLVHVSYRDLRDGRLSDAESAFWLVATDTRDFDSPAEVIEYLNAL